MSYTRYRRTQSWQSQSNYVTDTEPKLAGSELKTLLEREISTKVEAAKLDLWLVWKSGKVGPELYADARRTCMDAGWSWSGASTVGKHFSNWRDVKTDFASIENLAKVLCETLLPADSEKGTKFAQLMVDSTRRLALEGLRGKNGDHADAIFKLSKRLRALAELSGDELQDVVSIVAEKSNIHVGLVNRILGCGLKVIPAHVKKVDAVLSELESQ
jgi:hypothetical protein